MVLRNWLENRALSNPLCRSLLISDDGRIATLIVKTSAYLPRVTSADDVDEFDEDDAEATGGSDPTFCWRSGS